VPAAIHVTPECADGGPLACVRDGDLLRVDAERGELVAVVPQADWAARQPAVIDLSAAQWGSGRDLFGFARQMAVDAERGGGFIAAVPPPVVSSPALAEVAP
jgi:phosphogluconate dehydratase